MALILIATVQTLTKGPTLNSSIASHAWPTSSELLENESLFKIQCFKSTQRFIYDAV